MDLIYFYQVYIFKLSTYEQGMISMFQKSGGY